MVLTESLKSDVNEKTLERIKFLFSYGAIGSDDSVPSSGQTGLVSEVLRKKITDSSISGDTYTATLFIASTEANGEDLAEAGFFDKESNSTMWLREVFEKFLKTDDINLYLDAPITSSVVEL